jgi:predicted GH43/DUF377 family glycosyl hydrolase
MSGFNLRRLGVLMEPEAGNPLEAEGVLNPAAARGPDGHLYLFPRMVAKGNYSRIGIARVRFNDAGDPASVERLGIALEPEADYELRSGGGGGCEDPRVTFVEPLQRYIMSYTAFSENGPRIAFAESEDLLHWKRLGLATCAHWRGIDLCQVDDKDASLFPVAIPNSLGQLELGMLHRPMFAGTRPEETVRHPGFRRVDLERESIWISYCGGALKDRKTLELRQFTSHHRLATPVSPWERLKIGAGTPPILTKTWLADRVSRGQRGGEPHRGKASSVLLGRGHGAVQGASAGDPLPVGGAGAEAGTARGAQWNCRQRGLSDGDRPAGRSGDARPFRCLLWHGRLPGWRGAARRA